MRSYTRMKDVKSFSRYIVTLTPLSGSSTAIVVVYIHVISTGSSPTFGFTFTMYAPSKYNPILAYLSA